MLCTPCWQIWSPCNPSMTTAFAMTYRQRYGLICRVHGLYGTACGILCQVKIRPQLFHKSNKIDKLFIFLLHRR